MTIFKITDSIENVIDSDYAMSFIDKNYLADILFEIKMIKMPASINVCDIDNVIHSSRTYAVLDFYMKDVSEGKLAVDKIHREFHIVDELRCKTLVEMNIMTLEQMMLDFQNKIFYVSLYDKLIAFIRIAFKLNARIHRVVMTKKNIIFSLKSIAKVSIYMREKKLSDDKDYFFEFNKFDFVAHLSDFDDFYTHVIDCNMIYVNVKNNLSIVKRISRRVCLKLLIEYEKKECYQINFSQQNLIFTSVVFAQNFRSIISEILNRHH